MWDLIVSVPDHCLSFYFTCETSQVLLAAGQVDYIGDFRISSHLTIDSAQNE